MSASNTVKWHAVYTKPCWEKKVARLLELKKIEHYCPLQKVYRQWSDRKKVIHDPLFKSYVFVHVSAKDHVPVLETDGVLGFVTFQGKPAVVRDEEILIIRQFLREYKNITVNKLDLHVNDAVRITGGPLMMKEGTVVEVKSKTVKVLLPSLGFALTAEIEKDYLETIKGT